MSGPLFATHTVILPFTWEDAALAGRVTTILDEVVAHPQWMSTPMTPEQRRLVAAQALTNPEHLIWEVWHAERGFVGILLLTQVVPWVDATLHFLFFDRDLVGKRRLLQRFLAHAFEGLGFRRLTAHVPEDADKLLRFYRKMGFRFEGEHRATGLVPTAFLEAGAPGLSPIHNAAQWVARHGSRIEKVFWREDRWIDLYRLRLMRDEFVRPQTDEEPIHAVASYRSNRRPRRGRPRGEGPGAGTVADDPAVAAGPAGSASREHQPDALSPRLPGRNESNPTPVRGA